jgi:hypothetical protein
MLTEASARDAAFRGDRPPLTFTHRGSYGGGCTIVGRTETGATLVLFTLPTAISAIQASGIAFALNAMEQHRYLAMSSPIEEGGGFDRWTVLEPADQYAWPTIEYDADGRIARALSVPTCAHDVAVTDQCDQCEKAQSTPKPPPTHRPRNPRTSDRVCRWCEQRVRTFVPRADRSRNYFVRHHAANGSVCDGSHGIAPIQDS